MIGWGAVALGVVLGVGSAVTIARVEDDLRSRVAGVLESAGVDGVTVTFTGQDGTLRCAVPLDDPDGTRRIADAERGVRSITLGPGCSTDESGDGEDREGTDATGTTDATSATDTAPASEPPPTATTSIAPTTLPASTSTSSTSLPDPTTVLDILIDDPQFSVLKNALEAVDLGDLLGGPGPVTIFAPTDDAFAALGPNFNAALASDPEALEAVLRHHIVAADLPSDELSDGPLTMIDDTTIEVDTSSGVAIASDEIIAAVVDADLDAANGTVHVVDQVLLPSGIDLGVVAEVFVFVGRYDDGTMVLSGRVASEDQRARLVEAAQRFLPASAVDDQLVVDAEAQIGAADVDAVAELLALVPRDLVVGEVVVSVDGVFVSGIYIDRTAIDAAAAEFGASTGLTARPPATAAEAAALGARLNAAVAADSIRFESASAVLVPDLAVLDQLATIATSEGGIVITVEGHTDSDGSAELNQALSEARAEAVVAALVERGVPADDLVAVGRGSEQPVLVDGVEDKAASRRVEFLVETR